jgi:hypothetical protein
MNRGINTDLFFWRNFSPAFWTNFYLGGDKMSKLKIQMELTVEEIFDIIQQLPLFEKQQLFEKMIAHLLSEKPRLPKHLADKPWAQQANVYTKHFLELCGSWEDTRSTDEIVQDIYESRSPSRTEINL